MKAMSRLQQTEARNMTARSGSWRWRRLLHASLTVNLPLLHPSTALAVNDTVHHRIPVRASNPSEPERPLLLPTKPVHVAVDLPESGLA
ncbi:hypothetical protein HYQ44_003320 [Verticillium longisporum]|nr:hypothetical protein HYQ44_003320 [Verticillium longisporum]